MSILFIIYSLAVIWIIFFLLIYSIDLPVIDESDNAIGGYTPSISNLKIFDTVSDDYKKYFNTYTSMFSICNDVKSKVEKYIKNIIIPSYHYFILRGQIQKSFCYSSDSPFGFLVICSPISILMSIFGLCVNSLKVFPNKSLPSALYYIIVIASCIIISLGGCALIYAVHRKNKILYKCQYIKREDIDELCKGYGEEYEVSDRAGFLDHLILKELDHLQHVKREIIRKNTLSQVYSALMFVNVLIEGPIMGLYFG